MGVHDFRWEEIAEYLERARARRPQIAETLRFHETLLRLQYEAPAAPDLSAISSAELRGRGERGEPLLPRPQLRLDGGAAARLFRSLGKALAGRGDDVRKAVEAVEEALASGRLDLSRLLEQALADSEGPSRLAEQSGVDPELLALWAAAAVAPSAEACRRAVATLADAERWLRPICPICGSPPRLGELRGADLAAQRYLHCGLCGFAWPFRRQQCPFCGTTDHEDLLIWTVEEDRSCQVEVCRRCRRCLKLVDNKEFFGLIPFLEDLATPHLDLLASERGYR